MPKLKKLQVNNLRQKEEEFQTRLQNKLTKNAYPNTEGAVKKSLEVRDSLQVTTAEVASFTAQKKK